MDNIKESNKLIAEFMGYKFGVKHFFDEVGDEYNPKYLPNCCGIIYKGSILPDCDRYKYKEGYDDYLIYPVYYDSNWNWLMSAVSKCYEYGELDNHYRDEIIASLSGVIDIEDTYKAVVDFIKDYNSSNNTAYDI